MTQLRRTWMFLPFLLCGCGLRGDADLLEARLREQEDRLFALESSLNKANTQLASVRRENNLLHTRLAGNARDKILPEQAASLARVEGIRIQTLMTGGLDRDNQPGDDLLSAVISPHDADGETVKLPGTIRLQLIDPSRPKSQQQIGNWSFNLEDSRKHWHSGIVASGYQFRLPWQTVPDSSQLFLNATLTTADGRRFDSSEIIRITPPARAIAVNPNNRPGKFIVEDSHPLFEKTSPEENTASPFPIEKIESRSSTTIEPADGWKSDSTNGDGKPFNPAPPLRTSDNWTEGTIPRLR